MANCCRTHVEVWIVRMELVGVVGGFGMFADMDPADGQKSVAVVMPRIKNNAPGWAREWHRDRLVASATGVCPRCDGIVGVPDQYEMTGKADIEHEDGCVIADQWVPKSLSRWLV